MPIAKIVVAQGPIDGINTIFATGEPYVAGQTAYILNGRIHNQRLARGSDNDFGFVELSPDSGTIQVDVPPILGDVVQIFYWSRVLPLVQAVALQRITAQVQSSTRLTGTVRVPAPAGRVTGAVAAKRLTGTVRTSQPQRIAGVVGVKKIVGVIRPKD